MFLKTAYRYYGRAITAITILFLLSTTAGCGNNAGLKSASDTGNSNAQNKPQKLKETDSMEKISKSDEEWKNQLTELEFNVTRRKATERAFTGKYYDHHEKGVYTCICCGAELFSSEQKYNSGCGWPSYWAPIDSAAIEEHGDSSYGMVRTEIVCTKCGAHLGHVFEDGPQPTGQRYCVNSASLNFKKEGK